MLRRLIAQYKYNKGFYGGIDLLEQVFNEQETE